MTTHDGSILDLALLNPVAMDKQGSLNRFLRRMTTIAALACVGVLALANAAQGLRSALAADTAIVRLRLDDARAVEVLNVDDKSQILLDGKEAEARNAAIPIVQKPLGNVSGFALSSQDAGAYPTALKCLSQAIYYEAALEPLEGRRAVAQVVLNRLRHPAYPKSVCGVVYQGAERRTGCQFSFTCDGALLRMPLGRPWQEAEAIASQALSGYVEASVGTATHYHADYVLPRWAYQLGKIAQIGRHIFYRFNGGWGSASAFNARYLGHEFIPALNLLALRSRVQESGLPGETAVLANGLTVAPLITDRHAAADVGGRLDITKSWRLTIPDPVQASSRYRQALQTEASGAAPARKLAVSENDEGSATP